jgi:predicted GH43/DUF377 family glycosyl hydrolase
MSSTTNNAFEWDTASFVQKFPETLISRDSRDVILKRFFPSKIKIAARMGKFVAVIQDLDGTIQNIQEKFNNRHASLLTMLAARGKEVLPRLASLMSQEENTCFVSSSFDSEKRYIILGSFFVHEYSIQTSAIFNPSIVSFDSEKNQPDFQQQQQNGNLDCVMSLRACGEGHISSIVFRRVILNHEGKLSIPLSSTDVPFSVGTATCLDLPDESFYGKPTQAYLAEVQKSKIGGGFSSKHEIGGKSLFWNEITGHEFAVTTNFFNIDFEPSVPLDRRVLFPSTPSQSNGIEDARFVRFVEEEGASNKITYYSTFTAYDGKSIDPQMCATRDFLKFSFVSLKGNAVSNKGMALFPRKVSGKFWMLSRQDDENVMIMESDSLLQWDNPKVLMEPQQPWEMFKMGNCGSPLETPKGWLVLTHGVGPMRRYCIGAAMLDLHDPTKVIGRMKNPLIAPTETEREGYVPNVVYSCGAIIHNHKDVIIPYAMSDSASSFCRVSLEDIYNAL